jgi:predicted NBD/HSP70 family sugar kinase
MAVARDGAASTSEARRRTGTPTLAIDVGASRTRLALVVDAAVTRRLVTETATLARGDPSGIVAGLPETIAGFLGAEDVAGPRGVIAAGIGIAATVGLGDDIIASPDVPASPGTALRDAVADVIRVPVVVENDGNVAALAEHAYGAARGHDHAAVITLGTNIGLGLILDGRLYRGSHGAAGEVGLLLAVARTTGDRNGRGRPVDAGSFGTTSSRAPDGYVWIEELVGGGALAKAVGGRKVFGAAHPDPAATAAVDRAVEGWSLVIADLAVVLDPEVVVFVGELAVDAADAIPRVQRRVAELVARPPEVVLGTVGPDAQLLGADLLARAAAERAPIDARAGLSAQSIGG